MISIVYRSKSDESTDSATDEEGDNSPFCESILTEVAIEAGRAFR